MTQRLTLAMLALVGASISFSSAQQPMPGGVKPASHAEPARGPGAMSPRESALAGVPTPMRGLHVSAHSGAEWLVRVNNDVSGRFLPGWLPAVNSAVEEDSFIHQAAATAALARAARYYRDERYLMKGRQAMLSLLAETQLDPADSTCRVTMLPAFVVNRLAAAGALLVAIHELDKPADDLLKQGEELANFIRKQQQADGSFAGAESDVSAAGWALRGLMASMRSRPAEWKPEVAAKALPHYRQKWQAGPSLTLAACLTPGFVEAFVHTKDRTYATFVAAMCDWTCDQQYGPDTTTQKWIGGFKTIENGKPVLRAPDVNSAANVETLALGCLLMTKYFNDDPKYKEDARYNRYRQGADLGCKFLIGLQFTENNTGHFSPGYRTALIGGYHASLRDGNLRLDQHAMAVSAIICRLTCAGDR